MLVGDFLYSRAFQMMVEVRNMGVMEILADATNTIAEGEVMQLVNCHDPETTEARYLTIIRNKTAKLFEAAGRLGVVLSHGSPEEEQAMASYGRHVGTAYQLIDDVLDYSATSEQLGKNIGDNQRKVNRRCPCFTPCCTAMRSSEPWFARPSNRGGARTRTR